MDMAMLWGFARPYVWSFVRHSVLTGAAYVAAKTGVQIDDATVNGLSVVALQGSDLLVAAAGGLAGSALSNFGALKALVTRK